MCSFKTKAALEKNPVHQRNDSVRLECSFEVTTHQFAVALRSFLVYLYVNVEQSDRYASPGYV